MSGTQALNDYLLSERMSIICMLVYLKAGEGYVRKQGPNIEHFLGFVLQNNIIMSMGSQLVENILQLVLKGIIFPKLKFSSETADENKYGVALLVFDTDILLMCFYLYWV